MTDRRAGVLDRARAPRPSKKAVTKIAKVEVGDA
jgi:hypothetical protein